MYRIVIIVVGFIFLITSSGFAQRQITGKLIDSETKKPVKDALVKVEGKDLETKSNFLGFFQLTIDSLDQLLIDSYGYELALIQVPSVNSFQIALTKSTEKEETYLIVEKPATPPGSMPAFYEYIGKNLRYPPDARTKGISGRVFVEFVIDTTGSLPPEEIKVLKGVYKSIDDEAIRVIRNSPRWTPGTQNGKAVRQRMVMPITFEIDGHTTYYKNFYSFMSKNISYPLQARRMGLEGAVFVHFEVDQTGRVTNSAIIRDIDGGCGEEVNRVLLNVPAELVRSLIEQTNSRKFTLPVLFGLEKPFKNWEPPRSETVLLHEIHITAVNKSREVPSQGYRQNQVRIVPAKDKIHDLKQALEGPKNVRYLSLTNRSYTSFPMDILKLTNLEFLDLESNRLKNLPHEVEKLTELEELYLVENELQSLPGSFGNLKKMKILGLASNKLKSFPEEIISLENLETLDLSNNNLSTIPPSIGQLKNLKFLVLQNNGIKNLPPEFYQLKKLQIIMLQGNPIDAKEIELLKQSFKKAQIEL